jgi:TolA-binding protein
VKYRYVGVLTLLALPAYAPAASREIQELQRDVGLLQEQVKALQASQNEKFAGLSASVQQAIDNARDAGKSAAVIQSSVDQNLKGLQSNLEGKVVGPVASVGARMDQMSTDFRNLQNAVSDLTSIINKLQAQLTDLNNAVKILQAPPAPPPPTAGGSTIGGSGAPPTIEAPTVSATDLYNNGQRDRSSGKLDLALNEFSDYLKWYGNTDLAANAQFYIAYIHYSQADYDDALREFDLVLEKYPSDNNKIPDALFYKGMTLTRMGKRTAGAEEFKELYKRFPSSDLARQACSQLVSMGLRCASTGAAATKGVRRKS